jgi:hypothetical protein
MALGNLSYKTPNPINTIDQNLSAFEGCCVTLTAQATVAIASTLNEIPYGIIVVGSDSISPGTYPSQVAASALELVDAYGAVVQALAGTGGVTVNMVVCLEEGGGGELLDINVAGEGGDWAWGIALTDASAGEQFLLRFTPFQLQ